MVAKKEPPNKALSFIALITAPIMEELINSIMEEMKNDWET